MNRKISLIIWIALFLTAISCTKKVSESTLKKLVIPVSTNLRSVCFISADTGFICGGSTYTEATLLKTCDGGKTWVQLITYQGQILNSIVNNQYSRKLFTTGLSAKIISSNDGGTSWNVLQMPEWEVMQSMLFLPGDSVGICVGNYGPATGLIARSDNYGGGWVNVEKTKHGFYDVACCQDQLFACSYGGLYKSIDHGRSWKVLDVTGDFFNGINFPTNRVGYMCGRQGSILKTTDGGVNWETIRNGNNPLSAAWEFHDIVFADEKNGFICGEKGLLLKTSDGAKTWQRIITDTKNNLYQIYLHNNSAFVVGDGGFGITFYL